MWVNMPNNTLRALQGFCIFRHFILNAKTHVDSLTRLFKDLRSVKEKLVIWFTMDLGRHGVADKCW